MARRDRTGDDGRSLLNPELSASRRPRHMADQTIDNARQEEYRIWIREHLLRRHPVSGRPMFTQRNLAKALGVHPPQITRMLHGLRRISEQQIVLIAKHLGEDPPKPREPQYGNHNLTLPMVPVVGTIGAGIWYDDSPFELAPDLDDEPPMVSCVRQPMYRGFPHFAVQVRGRSMDKKIPDGAFAIWVPYGEARTQLVDGDFVVVQSRDGGKYEGTVKLLRFTPRGWELHPHSNDPQWQRGRGVISYHESIPEGADREVQIIGLVVGCHIDFGPSHL